MFHFFGKSKKNTEKSFLLKYPLRDHGSATEPTEPLLDIIDITETATNNVSVETLDLNYKKTIGENIKRLEKFKPRILGNLERYRPLFPYEISRRDYGDSTASISCKNFFGLAILVTCGYWLMTLILSEIEGSQNDYRIETDPLYQNMTCSEALTPYMKNPATRNICELNAGTDDKYNAIWQICSDLVNYRCDITGPAIRFTFLLVIMGITCMLLKNPLRKCIKIKYDCDKKQYTPSTMLSEDFLKNGELEFLKSQSITLSKNGAEMQQSIDNCVSELRCIEHAIKVMPVLSDVLKVLVAEYIRGSTIVPNHQAIIEVVDDQNDEVKSHVAFNAI